MAVPASIGSQNGQRWGPFLVGSSWYALTWFDDATNVRGRMKKASDPSSSWSTVGSGANEPVGAASGKSVSLNAEAAVIGTKIYVAFLNTTHLAVKVFDTVTDTWGAAVTNVTSATQSGPGPGDVPHGLNDRFSIAVNGNGDLAIAFGTISGGGAIKICTAGNLAAMTFTLTAVQFKGGSVTPANVRLAGGAGARWHVSWDEGGASFLNGVKNDGITNISPAGSPVQFGSMKVRNLASQNIGGTWKVVAIGDDSGTGLRWGYGDSADTLTTLTVASIAASFDAADAARHLGYLDSSWRFTYNRASGGPAIRTITDTGTALGTPATFRPTTGSHTAYGSLVKVTLAAHDYYGVVDGGNYDHFDTSPGSSLSRSLADTITIGDAVARGPLGFGRSLADTITIGDAVARSVVEARSLADSVTIGDTVARSVSQSRALADTLTIADTVEWSSLSSLTRGAGDTLTITDSVAGAVSATRAVGDAIAIGDSVARSTVSYSRGLADTIIIADSVSRQVSTTVPVRTLTRYLSRVSTRGPHTSSARDPHSSQVNP